MSLFALYNNLPHNNNDDSFFYGNKLKQILNKNLLDVVYNKSTTDNDHSTNLKTSCVRTFCHMIDHFFVNFMIIIN